MHSTFLFNSLPFMIIIHMNPVICQVLSTKCWVSYDQGFFLRQPTVFLFQFLIIFAWSRWTKITFHSQAENINSRCQLLFLF